MTLSTEPVALSFYTAIVVTIFLSYSVIRRLNQDSNKKGEKTGCFSGGYITLVIGALCLLFFPFLTILVESTIAYIDNPRYESTIVDIKSTMEEQSYTDSDGRSSTRDIMMHQAIVEFTDDYGKKRRMPNSIRSGEKPNITDTITVSYKDGKLQEFSFRAIAMFIGLAFILLIMGFCLLLIFNYSVNKSNAALIQLAQWFGIHFIAPATMILMFSLLSYVLVQYFLGNKDELPIFVIGILIFFCLMLFLAFIGYFRTLYSQNK